MTEKQIRDVLSRVVPEPPDSVADPSPVVRAARRQRQVRVVGVSTVAAVLVVGTFLGVRAVGTDDKDLVADPPASKIADPYDTAPCPSATEPWENGAVASLDGLVAVRYCNRPEQAGALTFVGPTDGLVVGLEAFAKAVREIPDADPGRCAAVSVVPIDNRVLFQLADGSVVGVGTGLCDDVQVEGRVIDGNALVTVLFTALREQRDNHSYSTASLPAPDPRWCGNHRGIGPALPSSEHLVAATWCGPRSPNKGGVVLDDVTVDRLDEAWRTAGPSDPDDALDCDEFGGSGQYVLALTDRGDVVTLNDQGCGKTAFSLYSGNDVSESLTLDFAIDELG